MKRLSFPLIVAVFALSCSWGETAPVDAAVEAVGETQEETVAPGDAEETTDVTALPDETTVNDLPPVGDVPGEEAVTTDLPVDETAADVDGDVAGHDLPAGDAEGCGGGPACPSDQECCFTMSGTMSCVPKGQCMFSCGGGCQNGMICCNYFGQIQMCMPEDMCPGEIGGCTKDEECKAGQVCCKFGEMAAQPTCMAEAMCPKNCTKDEDCPATQECCDLKDTVVCVDKGQCPERCYHSTTECPLGQECCDAGDGLLVCVSDAECPGSVPCADAAATCYNSEGKPLEGVVCCDVPEVGFRCVGSGGCGDWQTCSQNTDCPDGRECCPLKAGNTCVPTGACPVKPQYTKCIKHEDCVHDNDMCCIVPGMGRICAAKAECPSQCLIDGDCVAGAICCIVEGSPAQCMAADQCGLMGPCDADGKCGAGQECCDMLGSKVCMPTGQCMAGPCKTDADCPGQKCCNIGGQMACMPQCF
jgi:hypothetical protein